MTNSFPFSPKALEAWFATPAGQQLMTQETGQFRAALPLLIGYRLLQIGAWGNDEQLFCDSPMLQHWVLGLADGPRIHARIEGHALPVASRSVDAVLLPHSLELVKSPHRLLREVDRVLCNHGHVIIQGFNPWGLWAARQGLPWGKQRFPQGARFYTLNRVRDWLELLDFDVVEVRRYGPSYPLEPSLSDDGTGISKMIYSPLCQAYQVLARKRVVPLTPLRQRWVAGRVVAPAALPEARVHRVR